MDPDACLKALDEALDEKDSEGVYEYATALSEWMCKHGANPFTRINKPGKDWRSGLSRYAVIAYLDDLTRACGPMDE